MSDARDRVQRLWCQHCKALQKTNDTVVECWYNPLDDEKRNAFCAANEDAVNAIFAEKTKTEHKTIQGLVDKFVAIEKRATQIDIAEMTESITENNCLTDEEKVGHLRFMFESLKKGV